MSQDIIADNKPISVTNFEGEMLGYLWDADEPQSAVELYESIFLARKKEQQEMMAPSTIAVMLSRMTQQGLLCISYPQSQKSRGRAKGYYAPTVSRARVTVAVLNAASQRLTGQPFTYFLTRLNDTARKKTDKADAETGLEDLVAALKELQQQSAAA